MLRWNVLRKHYSFRVKPHKVPNHSGSYTEHTEFGMIQTKPQKAKPECGSILVSIPGSSGNLPRPLLPEGPCVVSCPKTRDTVGLSGGLSFMTEILKQACLNEELREGASFHMIL